VVELNQQRRNNGITTYIISLQHGRKKLVDLKVREVLPQASSMTGTKLT
jgi:hypothetical protein